MTDESRRVFIGRAFGLAGGAGLVASLVAMKKTWDPLPGVISAGVTTVDLSGMEVGRLKIAVWRGKPVFFLRHPDNSVPDPKRTVPINGHSFSIMIGICTHLGCIPAYREAQNDFFCACHGGVYDADGVNTFGPPPAPLPIPPFRIVGDKVVLGEEGSEYKRLMA